MERQNKKESVATFHKESILAAAEKLTPPKDCAAAEKMARDLGDQIEAFGRDTVTSVLHSLTG